MGPQMCGNVSLLIYIQVYRNLCKLSVVIKTSALLRKDSGSNLGSETDFPD